MAYNFEDIVITCRDCGGRKTISGQQCRGCQGTGKNTISVDTSSSSYSVGGEIIAAGIEQEHERLDSRDPYCDWDLQ